MKVKVIKRAWNGHKLLEPGDVVNIECEKVPSWARLIEPVFVKTSEGINKENNIDLDKQKVFELPEEERNILLNQAKELQIKGSLEQFKVITLKEKIKEALLEKAEGGNE